MSSTLLLHGGPLIRPDILPQSRTWKYWKPSEQRFKTAFSSSTSFASNSRVLLAPRRAPSQQSSGPCTAKCLLGAEHLLEALPHFVLGVGVGLPCTVMECGDVIHRSTLRPPDPFHPSATGIALLLLIGAYFWATPGVAPGFFDMFVLAPLEQRFRTRLKKARLSPSNSNPLYYLLTHG